MSKMARVGNFDILLYPIHTEIFAPKINEINFIPGRTVFVTSENIVRPITGHGRLFVTSEENRSIIQLYYAI